MSGKPRLLDLYCAAGGAGMGYSRAGFDVVGVDHNRQGTPWIPQCGGASRKAGYTGDLNNAIPPAFTEWLGGHLMHELSLRREAA